MERVEFTRNFREEAEMLVDIWATSREVEERDRMLLLEKILRNEGMVREVKELYGQAAALRLISGVEIAGDSWRGKFRMLDEGDVLRSDEKYYVLDGDFKAEEMPFVNNAVGESVRVSGRFDNKLLSGKVSENESAADILDLKYEIDDLGTREKLLKRRIAGLVRAEIVQLRRRAAGYKERFREVVDGVRGDIETLKDDARVFKLGLASDVGKDVERLKKRRNGLVQRSRNYLAREREALQERYAIIRQGLSESIGMELAEIKKRASDVMTRAREGVNGKVEGLRRKVDDARGVQDLLAINPRLYRTTQVGTDEVKKPFKEVIPIHSEYNPEVDYRYGISGIPESVVVTRILRAYEPSSGVLNRAMKLVTPLVNSPGLVRRVWEAHGREIKVGGPGNSVDPDWYRKVMEPWVRDNKWIKRYYRGKT